MTASATAESTGNEAAKACDANQATSWRHGAGFRHADHSARCHPPPQPDRRPVRQRRIRCRTKHQRHARGAKPVRHLVHAVVRHVLHANPQPPAGAGRCHRDPPHHQCPGRAPARRLHRAAALHPHRRRRDQPHDHRSSRQRRLVPGSPQRLRSIYSKPALEPCR